MKKIIFVLTALFAFNAVAQTPTKIPQLSEIPDNSPAAFGTMAGVAYACKAGKKLQDFELIVSYLLVNSAPSKRMEKAFMQEYALAKKTAMEKQERNPPMPCSTFLKQFNSQKIFNSTVMSDGSVKTPDGSWSLPRGQKEPPKGYE